MNAAAELPKLSVSPPIEAQELSPQLAEAMVRAVETARTVARRHQFFIWSQGPLHPLLPHRLMVCGAYQRQRRALGFEVFQSVVLSAPLLAELADAQGPLLRAASSAWVMGRGRALLLDAARLGAEAAPPLRQLRDEAGITRLLVHGVARPQRPGEIESLFLFGDVEGGLDDGRRLLHAELLLPQLHSTWRCAVATESEIHTGPLEPAMALRAPHAPGKLPAARTLTEREHQILLSARDGKSNQQIGEQLGISPLTVKNHIQKILRKLGASNRAHAVALAMAQEQLQAPLSR